jgi:hypothetical protein
MQIAAGSLINAGLPQPSQAGRGCMQQLADRQTPSASTVVI